jgi:hypothetical protein
MNAHFEAQLKATKAAVQKKVQNVKPHPLGHAFLWGTVEAKYKNGKSKYFKVCLGSVCADDLDECVRLAETVPGVTNVYYNMD